VQTAFLNGKKVDSKLPGALGKEGYRRPWNEDLQEYSDPAEACIALL